jgi:hypothetical protein
MKHRHIRPTAALAARAAGLLTSMLLTATPAAQAQAIAERTPVQRLFISGHSLTDPPLPQQLSAIAASLVQPMQWNMQSIPGSPIRVRSHGAGPAHAYRHGSNREGSNMDVLAEWSSPQTVTGGLYDTLLITEQHGVLGALAWHDSVAALQSTHETFIGINPRATTWFYESWLGIHNKDNPARWIAYERAASPVWRCVAQQANLALASKPGFKGGMESIPSGAALAHLVERAAAGLVPGVSAATKRATIEALFSDDVHLTPLGSYYMASVVYATVWGRSPVGAAVPQGLNATAAATLQQEAWRFITAHHAQRMSEPPLTMQSCRSQLKRSFIGLHWAYVRDSQWTRETHLPAAYGRWLKQMVAWHLRIRKLGADNPFADR